MIAFVQRFDGLSFLDAVRLLAQACGEALPQSFGQRASGPKDRRAEVLLDAVQRAEKLYARMLYQPEGQEALAYARDRGLADEILRAFGVGFAPRTGNPLLQAARQAGFDEGALVESGLVRKTDEERAYDFFRGRLLIPIRDLLGRPVGFGGRKLPGDELPGAKYVNTAETPLFKKSRLIFGLDLARADVRRTKHLILMEGYTDVMAAHQVGIASAAAVLGTATTEDHAALVRRSGARRVTLVFDGDEAGSRAGLRALEHLLPLGLQLDVVVLPEGTDPCDFCLQEGADAFRALLDGATDWYAHALGLLEGLTGPRLAEEVDEVLKLVQRLAKPVERDARIGEMASALGLSKESVVDQARELARRRRPATRASQASRQPSDPARRPAPRPASGVPEHVPGDSYDSDAEPPAPSGVGDAPAPAALPDPLLEQAFRDLLGAVLLDNSLIPSLRGHRAGCPAGKLEEVLTAILELYDEGDEEAPIDAAAVLTALGASPARDLVVPLSERARAAESPQVLARDQLGWLERRDREHQIRRDYSALPTGSDLDDPLTRDALSKLHRNLRGTKVPASSGTNTPPSS